MAEPQYPTQEGLWSKGARKEESYAGVKLGTPYEKAVENFRRAIEGREDFDPAVLFVWGTMQAKAVLNILKAAEEMFGEAGQAMVRKAINKAGYEAAEGLAQELDLPGGFVRYGVGFVHRHGDKLRALCVLGKAVDNIREPFRIRHPLVPASGHLHRVRLQGSALLCRGHDRGYGSQRTWSRHPSGGQIDPQGRRLLPFHGGPRPG